MNTNPCMEVDMRAAVLGALDRRGAVQDDRAAGGLGLQNQTIYGKPAIAAGGKKKRKPRKKKAKKVDKEQVKEIAGDVGEVLEEAKEGLGKKKAGRKRKVKNAARSAGAKKAAASNPWIAHLKKYHAAHPGKSYKQNMKDAKASYKKK